MKYINPHRWDIFFSLLFFIMLIKMMIYENNLNSCCVSTFRLHNFILSYLALREKKETERKRERGRERDLQHFILIFSEKPILWKLILISINWSIAISFKQAHHVEVEVFFHPVCSRVKLFKHLHDVKGIQSIHYGCSFYASCKKKTE